eukprot:scaffold1830_cov246-Pinguiococcus_pyrenoidosus.AAC.19
MAEEDIEERFSALEQQYVALTRESTTIKATAAATSAENDQLKSEVERLKKQLEENATSQSSSEALLREKDDMIARLRGDAASSVERADRSASEVDRLKDELSDNLRAAREMSRTLAKARDEVAQKEAKIVELKLEQERALKSKESVEKHNAWLEEELKLKTEELLSLRRRGAAERIELQTKTTEAQAEASLNIANLKTAKEEIQKLNALVEKERQALLDAQNENTTAQQKFDAELRAQTRFAELHKERALDAERSLEREQELTQSLQGQLAHQSERLRSEINELLERHEAELDKQKADASAAIKQLEEALNKAKEERAAEEESRQMALSANVLDTGLQITNTGMNITEVYENYERKSRECDQYKAEKERLEIYLSRILKDIEEKAPVLAAQKREYQRVLQSYGHLTTRYEEACKELEEVRSEAMAAADETDRLREENGALQQEVQDVSAQLRAMLQKEMGGGAAVIPDTTPATDFVRNSEETISEHLVRFSSVEELQKKNAQLLRVVRKLSRRVEEEDTLALSESRIEHQAALKQALKRLEELRTARSRQEEMMTVIVQQRDMYRVLLAQADARYASASPKKTLSASASPAEASLATAAMLPTTGTEGLETELEQLRDQVTASKEAARIQGETADRMRQVRHGRHAEWALRKRSWSRVPRELAA